MNASTFDRWHPAVLLMYCVCVIVLCMAVFHPVYIAVGLVSGVAVSMYLRGWRPALRSLAWQVPLVAVIALLNPLFSASGSTELFRIGVRAVYAESCLYGACMGALLMAMTVWFSNASHVVTSDKAMALSGNAAPIVTLMVSMTARLVPTFVRRGDQVQLIARACPRIRPTGARARFSSASRTVSVLMGWMMEDSLETSDSMRARGWGATQRRTVYARYRFRLRDGVAMVFLVLLAMANAVFALQVCGDFSFYPTVGTVEMQPGYVAYAIFCMLPLIVAGVEALRWKVR